jgi:hypothetical protein
MEEPPGSLEELSVMLARILVILALSHFCLAQVTNLGLREIGVSSSKPIQAPPFSYFGEGQCDSNGNMYFHGGDSDFRSGQVFRLSSDGASGNFFHITGKLANADRTGFDSFWVTADGDVFILAANAQEKYVFGFDRDGTAKNPVSLNVSEDVQLTDLALFDNGFLFVWGYHDERASKNLRGKRYAAILTASGDVVKELSLPISPVDLKDSSALTDGAVASYAGNLYFLGSDQITVISVTGELIRRLKFHKPDSEAIASKLYISGGIVVIALNKISDKGSTKGQVQRSFLALDQNSGDLLGYYSARAVAGSDVCFSRADGLTFLQVDGKTQKLATALLR